MFELPRKSCVLPESDLIRVKKRISEEKIPISGKMGHSLPCKMNL
jgi:hypothetical protein